MCTVSGLSCCCCCCCCCCYMLVAASAPCACTAWGLTASICGAKGCPAPCEGMSCALQALGSGGCSRNCLTQEHDISCPQPSHAVQPPLPALSWHCACTVCVKPPDWRFTGISLSAAGKQCWQELLLRQVRMAGAANPKAGLYRPPGVAEGDCSDYILNCSLSNTQLGLVGALPACL